MTALTASGYLLAALGTILAASQVFTLHPIPALVLAAVVLWTWGGCLIVDGAAAHNRRRDG